MMIFLYLKILKKVKFIEGEKNNFKITNQKDFINLKKFYESKNKNRNWF